MADEKNGTKCPLCKNHILVVHEGMVSCEGYQPKKDEGGFYNSGDCNFFIAFKQKLFGRALTPQDIKRIVLGQGVKDSKGNEMLLDVSDETPYFTKIVWAQKKQPKAL